MSLNVPPAEGVSPADAAKELRQILRDAYRHGGKNTPDVSHLYIQARTAFQSLAYGGRARGEIMELLPIARRRRPSETRQRLDEMWRAEGCLQELFHLLYQIRHTLADFPTGDGVSKDALCRAYALVQVIPSYNDLPQGKEENILRAIMAIIKAHYGIIEGGPEQLPNVVSHLLSNALSQEKENSQVKEIWTPIPAPHGAVVSVAHELEPDPYPQGPFKIVQPNYGSKNYHYTKANFHNEIWEIWKDGKCSFPEAKQAFEASCKKYYKSNVALLDASEKVLAEYGNHVTTWHVSIPEVSNAKNQPEENISTSNTSTF